MSTSRTAPQAPLAPANPGLDRFNPLGRILSYDDFDRGLNGWTELLGNHDGDLDHVRPSFRDLRPPQLSTLSFFDIGSHGPMTGTYAMKLATRPLAGHTACAIKRMTLVGEAPVQLEMYFAVKAEARQGLGVYGEQDWDGNRDLSEADFGSFTISNDIGRLDGTRYHCALRYINADSSGNLVQRWHAKTSLQPTSKMQLRGETPSGDFHTVDERDWRPVIDGDRALCYNEVPTKVNWHYLRWLVDVGGGRSVELQVNDHVMDLRDVEVPTYPEHYEGLRGLFNLLLDVQSTRAVRNLLFVDSALVSVGW
jgi:hypothetical protein